MARKSWFRIGLLAFAIMLVLAWFGKPQSLKKDIEQAGIKLHRVENENLSQLFRLYIVSAADRSKLIPLLKKRGFEVAIGTTESDTELFWMQRNVSFLGLLKRPQDFQYVGINPVSKRLIEFQPDLE